MHSSSSQKISVFALVLLITGAIDSIRNLPTTALFGSTLIFFCILSAVFFLIPVALVAAELSAAWSEEEGGIYSWVQRAFGDTAAFLTIWLQWVNTMVWYPTMLLFLASTLAYLINPALAENKIYLLSVYLTLFWGLTLLSLSGLRSSARFASFCTISGMILPMSMIIGFAMVWVFQGKPLAITFTWNDLIPQWHDTQSWVSLMAIMTSFLGMELAAVHVRHIHHPQRNYPRAMFFSVLLILSTVVLGSLAIAIVLPRGDISLVSGVMQLLTRFFKMYHLMFLMPFMVILILIGCLGSMVNWVISPAKGLMLAAKQGFLPEGLYRFNRHGAPVWVLLMQAVLVSATTMGFLLFPSVNAIYWLFTALSTELYILMYVMMFLAAIKLKWGHAHVPRPFTIPGGKFGYYLTCICGLLGCIITLIIGFFPPAESIDMGGSAHFRFVFASGIGLMLSPALVLYFIRRHRMT